MGGGAGAGEPLPPWGRGRGGSCPARGSAHSTEAQAAADSALSPVSAARCALGPADLRVLWAWGWGWGSDIRNGVVDAGTRGPREATACSSNQNAMAGVGEADTRRLEPEGKTKMARGRVRRPLHHNCGSAVKTERFSAF